MPLVRIFALMLARGRTFCALYLGLSGVSSRDAPFLSKAPQRIQSLYRQRRVATVAGDALKPDAPDRANSSAMIGDCPMLTLGAAGYPNLWQ